MNHLTHTPFIPVDERCAGCPALLASEIRRVDLQATACDYAMHAVTTNGDDVGCRKGQRLQNALVSLRGRLFFGVE